MKKYSLIYLVIILFSFSCSKDEVSELQSDYFIKFYGNFLEDNGYAVQPTDDGGLIITGSVERLGTGKDIVLIKTDAYGNQAEWSPKYFEYGIEDEGYSVINTDDGYLIAGTITNDGGNKDAIIIQTDLQGNIVGDEFIYDGTEDHYAVSIEERSPEGHMVVGYSINPSDQTKSFFVITLDEGLSNPKITRSSSRGEEFIKVIRNTDTEYLALGNQFRSDDSQIFIAKLNETGNIFDLAFIGSENLNEILGDAVATDDSTLFLYGSVTEEGNMESQLFLKKLVNLKEEWTRTITGSGSLSGKAITTGSDGELIIAADKTLGDDTNILIYFLDEEGTVINSREYGETGDQTVEDILYSGDNLIILGGNAYEENRMINLIKADSNGNIWE